jgi:Protein of unknown function (DUF3105)
LIPFPLVAKKKKSRVPAPPKGTAKRPVQAPRAYKAPPNPRRTRLLFIAVGAVIAVAGAGVGIAMALGGGGGGTIESEFCRFQTFPDQAADMSNEERHPPKLAKGFEYSTTPATSGPHGATVVFNVYTEPLPQFNVVHNLEHGGVVVQYGSGVSEEAVSQIVDWYSQDPRGLVVAPLPPELEQEDPSLRTRIALTSWTHLMTCSRFDEGAFDDFLDEYRGPQGDAPEKADLDALQQGGQ